MGKFPHNLIQNLSVFTDYSGEFALLAKTRSSFYLTEENLEEEGRSLALNYCPQIFPKGGGKKMARAKSRKKLDKDQQCGSLWRRHSARSNRGFCR